MGFHPKNIHKSKSKTLKTPCPVLLDLHVLVDTKEEGPEHLLRTSFDSVVASAIFYGAVGWSSSIFFTHLISFPNRILKLACRFQEIKSEVLHPHQRPAITHLHWLLC